MRLNRAIFFLLYIIKSFYNHINSLNSVWFLETFSKTKLILVCKSTDYVISSLIGLNSNYINIHFFFNKTSSKFLSLCGGDNKRTGFLSSDASVGDKIRYYTTIDPQREKVPKETIDQIVRKIEAKDKERKERQQKRREKREGERKAKEAKEAQTQVDGKEDCCN